MIDFFFHSTCLPRWGSRSGSFVAITRFKIVIGVGSQLHMLCTLCQRLSESALPLLVVVVTSNLNTYVYCLYCYSRHTYLASAVGA